MPVSDSKTARSSIIAMLGGGDSITVSLQRHCNGAAEATGSSSYLASIIVAWFSRYREFRADAGAVSYMGQPNSMISAGDLGSRRSWMRRSY